VACCGLVDERDERLERYAVVARVPETDAMVDSVVVASAALGDRDVALSSKVHEDPVCRALRNSDLVGNGPEARVWLASDDQ
jgi:hypothetical protein